MELTKWFKRMAGLLALLSLTAAFTAGCRRAQTPAPDKRISVVTTLFPYYDFVRQTAGDRVNITLVVPAGMDSHSFEPTPADMITIQNADVLICNGGEMEHWLSQVLDSIDTSNMKIVTMMDYVDAVEEEHVEGMEDAGDGHDHADGEAGHSHADEDPAHSHEDQEAGHSHADEDPAHSHEDEESAHSHAVEDPAHSHENEETARLNDSDLDGHEMLIEYDEHIWTSPVNAMAIVRIISETLQEAVPGEAERIEANTEAYLADLKELDASFRQVSADRKRNLIVVADKFPFRYLADEYGLSYRAAFSGCSSDTEPSAKTIAYLIDKIKTDKIPVVYYLELSSHSTARVISEETGARPLLLHSCHNVTRREFDQGVTYLQLMKQNVENLRQGLD